LALVIAAGLWAVEAAPGGIPGVALCWAPVRWIGRISYGLYLWHWPVIIWLSSGWTHGRRPLELAEVALTFAIATASYYLVELPIRTGKVPWLRLSIRRLALVMGAAVAVVAALAVAATRPNSAVAQQVADIADPSCPAG